MAEWMKITFAVVFLFVAIFFVLAFFGDDGWR